jgi:hypothetical protein
MSGRKEEKSTRLAAPARFLALIIVTAVAITQEASDSLRRDRAAGEPIRARQRTRWLTHASPWFALAS